MNYVDRVRNICGSMLVIAILGGAIAASAETEYPVLDPRYSYAHQRHGGECRVGGVGVAYPTNAGCNVSATVSPVWVNDLGAERGLLRFQYAFMGSSSEEFAGVFFTFGRMGVETVTTNGTPGPDLDLHADGTFNFDRLELTGGTTSSIERIRVELRQIPPYTNLLIRAEVEDSSRAKGYLRFPFTSSNSQPMVANLPLSSFIGSFDRSAVKVLSLVVEENHWVDGVHNPKTGGFDLLKVVLVDDQGDGDDAASIVALDSRGFVMQMAWRDFETLWRLQDATTGACLDRTLFRDLLHWGATGWLLASLPFAVGQGWVTSAEAEARALKIIRFIDNDALWGDGPSGNVGNSRGMMYRFGGIDPSGLAGSLTGTRKLDLGSVNAVEASTIDTALFMMGLATCASGFDEATSCQTEIRNRATSILRRVHWNELVDPESHQFYMAWKPEEDPAGGYCTPATFGGYWASRETSGSQALTIDYWTAEGAMAALLASGSTSYPVSPDVWYTMFRQVRNGVALTWPGAWFTYTFLQSTYLDPSLGPDRGAEYGVRAIDWQMNAIAAFEAYKAAASTDGVILPDAVELPDITYEAQGQTSMAVNNSARFTGTLTPYSLQMTIGLGGSTAESAIIGLKQMISAHPDMWDPLVGVLDSCNTNLESFPNKAELLRTTGPWIQQQKWPLNTGAALLAEINYLTTGAVWRLAMRSPMLSNGVERIYRQPRTNGCISVGMSIPGGNDAWSCAISGATIIFPDGYQEIIHFFDRQGTYLGAIDYSAIGDALATSGISVERSGGPAGLRDAAALPDGDFVVLVAGPGTDALLRVTTNREVSVMAYGFGDAMDKGDEIGNFPRVAVGGDPATVLVTINSPVQGVAVLGTNGVFLHRLVLNGQYHGLAVERGSNRLFLLRSDGLIQDYPDLMVTGQSPSNLASLPSGVWGRDLAYSVTWWTDLPALLATGSDGHIYRIAMDNLAVTQVEAPLSSGVVGVDVFGNSGVMAQDESGTFQFLSVLRSPLCFTGPVQFNGTEFKCQLSGTVDAFIKFQQSFDLKEWTTTQYATLESGIQDFVQPKEGHDHIFYRARYEY